MSLLDKLFIGHSILFFFSGCENFLDVGFDYLKAVDLGYVSPKLNELVQLFHSFG